MTEGKPVNSFDSGNFSYELPKERIAQEPLANRDDSRLLVYNSGLLEHLRFKELPTLLNHSYGMVFNDTKVVHARLEFFKPSGARIEIFCLEPVELSMEEALSARKKVKWKCLVGNARKWKSGSLFMKVAEIELRADLLERENANFSILFQWEGDQSFAEVLLRNGQIPLPPYIERQADETDQLRYQTILASAEGAVAAPTASLHFSEKTLNDLQKRRIERTNVTLHVGAGTFRPIDADDYRLHEMHSEEVRIERTSLETLLNWINQKKKVLAVGTTAMRSLESLYWLGCDMKEKDLPLRVDQNRPYAEADSVSTKIALERILEHLKEGSLEAFSFRTSLMIRPGYRFKVCQALLTNFHMPGSTLLLLVAAFIGEDWKSVYNSALFEGYRFLSYGDSSLLMPQPE